MLVLSRKEGEIITIELPAHLVGAGAEPIRVRVVEIHGTRVTLAVDAPRSIKILRGELRERPDHKAA